MSADILILPGDGIGPEIIAQAVRVLDVLRTDHGLEAQCAQGLLGGAAIEATGVPLPPDTLELARHSKGILLGAVGGPRWDGIDRALRPERGLLQLRSDLDLFANLRPAVLYPQLAEASSLKPELVAGLDIMIVRELTGGIYFGEPRGIRTLENGERQGFNTLVYNEHEVERILRVAFETATRRGGRLCSVDKANVLEATVLWREVAESLAKDYPQVTLEPLNKDHKVQEMPHLPEISSATQTPFNAEKFDTVR